MWRTVIPSLLADVVLFLLWSYLYRVPGKPKEWMVAETVFAFLLMMALSHILAPAQYVATALNRPLIDSYLARADSMLGIDVRDLADWLRAHPFVNMILCEAYATLLWQFVLIVPILGLALRDRQRLWEYIFNFHFCAFVTVMALAIIPAECAFQHLRLNPRSTRRGSFATSTAFETVI